jgi:hypothetical protein
MIEWMLLGLLLEQSTQIVTLAWNPNPPEDEVTKYTLYWDKGNCPCRNKLDVPAGVTVVVISNLPQGKLHFQVTATNIWGESRPSNEVRTTAAPDLD